MIDRMSRAGKISFKARSLDPAGQGLLKDCQERARWRAASSLTAGIL